MNCAISITPCVEQFCDIEIVAILGKCIIDQDINCRVCILGSEGSIIVDNDFEIFGCLLQAKQKQSVRAEVQFYCQKQVIAKRGYLLLTSSDPNRPSAKERKAQIPSHCTTLLKIDPL